MECKVKDGILIPKFFTEKNAIKKSPT
jgi:hypothetical protein